MRILVVGGSVAGLFTANMAMRRGFDVHIVERTKEELAARGAGIARHPEMAGPLRLAGAEHVASGVEVVTRTAYDRDGRSLAVSPYHQILSSWSSIQHALRAAFPNDRYHLGRELVGLDTASDGLVATFADGSTMGADVVVGADGLRSTVRKIVAPGVDPIYAGYVAWRGLLDETKFPEGLDDHFYFLWPPASQHIGYLVPGPGDDVRPGHRRMNFLWYYPVKAGADLDALLTDAQGRRFSYSIPPPLIRPEAIADIKAQAAAQLPHRFAEVVNRAESFLLQPIYDVISARMGFERVALIGDAAFVARPHVGLGVLKAAQDAVALVEALATERDVGAALARYDRERLGPGRDAVAYGRHLGAFIGRDDQPWTDPSHGLDAEYILRETARPVPHDFAKNNPRWLP